MAKKKKKSRPRRGLLTKLEIGGRVFEVEWKNSDIEWGSAWFSKGKIFLSPEACDGLVLDTLLHELIHVAINVSGCGFRMKRDLRLSDAQWERLEEDVVRYLTPILLAPLKRLGFRLPTR